MHVGGQVIHNIAMLLIQDEEIHMAYALQLAELEEAATAATPVGPKPLDRYSVPSRQSQALGSFTLASQTAGRSRRRWRCRLGTLRPRRLASSLCTASHPDPNPNWSLCTASILAAT